MASRPLNLPLWSPIQNSTTVLLGRETSQPAYDEGRRELIVLGGESLAATETADEEFNRVHPNMMRVENVKQPGETAYAIQSA